MGQNTKIEWATHTFNPWMGCTKVSDGCKFCYAENLMDSRWGKVKWGPSGTRIRTSDANWREPLAWNKAAERKGERARVFCASLADVFEDRPELLQWRWELFEMIVRTPHLDWLLLTKRPENALRMMVEAGLYAAENPNLPCPQPNIWIGTSVENQEAADLRIPLLLNIPAVVRFLSCEPLLGPVNLQRWWMRGWHGDGWIDGDAPVNAPHGKVAWAIIGGESGPNARPMNIEWARSLRDQCVANGVSFHFKQFGEWKPADYVSADGKMVEIRFVKPGPSGPRNPQSYEWSPTNISFKVGKKAAGRELDGRSWDELPTPPKSLSSILH